MSGILYHKNVSAVCYDTSPLAPGTLIQRPCEPGETEGNTRDWLFQRNSETGELEASDALKDAASPRWWIEQVLQPFLAWVMWIVLKIVSLFMGIGGILLNGVIYYTVVQVAENYANIGAINIAWGTVRDVANMGFIFILLYAAIQTILGIGGDNKKLIVNVVVVAVLINFSLFFTKIVIDISNVLALLFYEAIVGPVALKQAGTLSITAQNGLGNAFMNQLNLQSLMATGQGATLNPGSIITVGVMGSIMILIAAFIFFAVAIMFVIRYVVLILVLILSPLAFLGFVLPEAGKYKDQWLNALLGQAFFAPIYFLLTWITLKILGGITGTISSSFSELDSAGAALGPGTGTSFASLGTNPEQFAQDPGMIAMFINFAIIIVFLIVSLVTAKEWATRLPGGAGKIMSWATGVAGGATLGMAGRLSRQTIGRAGQALGDNDRFKNMAASKNMLVSTFGKAGLKTGRKIGETSFDLRSSPLGGQLDAGKGVKGFSGYREDKDKAEEKFAKSLGPSDKTKAKTKKALEEAEKAERRKREEITQNIDSADEEIRALKPERPDIDSINSQIAENERIANSSLVPEAAKREAQVKLQDLEAEKAELLQNFEREMGTYESRRGEKINELVSGSKEGQTLKSAQEIHAKVHGVKEDDAKKKLNAEQEDKEKNDPVLNRQKELAESVTELTKQVEKATGVEKERLQTELEAQQKELEFNKKEADARRKTIKSEFEERKDSVKKVDSAGDARKKDYAEALEKSRWAKAWGYNYTAAAKIRKGESTKDKAAKVLKDLAKESGVDIEEKKEEEPKTPPTNTA